MIISRRGRAVALDARMTEGMWCSMVDVMVEEESGERSVSPSSPDGSERS